MKKHYCLLFPLLLFCFWGLFSYNCIKFNINFYHYSFKNALTRFLFYPFVDTMWSSDFSEKKFSKIRTKMSEKEVISIIGEPLKKNCIKSCEWMYTWHKSKTGDFDWRSVTFDHEGLVIAIRRDFFID